MTRFLTTKLIVQLLKTEFVQMFFTLLTVISRVDSSPLPPSAVSSSVHFFVHSCVLPVSKSTQRPILYYIFFGTVSENKAVSSFSVFGERNRPVAIKGT